MSAPVIDNKAVLDLAAAILDECRVRIQANMARKYRTTRGERWVNASGRSSAAFKVITTSYASTLVYRGDDVAPLESIEYGHDDAPGPEAVKKWWREKFGGEIDDSRARAIDRKIAERGTERFGEPQEWIITPEVEEAVRELRDRLPEAARLAVNKYLNLS